MSKPVKLSPEARARAVRLALEQRGEQEPPWAAAVSLTGKLGATPPMLNRVCQHERNSGQQEGITNAEAARVKVLERKVRETRRATEILNLAGAFFAPRQSSPHRERFAGRVDLPRLADRTVERPPPRRLPTQPGTTPSPRPAPRGGADAYAALAGRELACLRHHEGLTATGSRS
ncbi:MAG: hypothetical protein JNL93_24780 [Pelomonas sp.]|nr:hypothetical protein [Roseateles sp.]